MLPTLAGDPNRPQRPGTLFTRHGAPVPPRQPPWYTARRHPASGATKELAMPTTEAYRPGLLSSLLLGTETQGTGAEGVAAPAKDAAVVAVSGTAQPADDDTPSAKKKKKKKEKAKKVKIDSDSADVAASPPDEERPVVAAAPVPAEGVEGLASLFSPGNLKKFKRRERADKEADAAEVQ